MKRYYFGVMLVLPAFLYAQKGGADQEAIRNVVMEETRTFFARDHAAWARHYLQDSTLQMQFAGPGYYYNIVGWDSMDRWRRPTFKAPPLTGDAVAPFLNKFNLRYRIDGNAAFVSFKEGLSEKTATDQTRLLVKQAGVWKITGGTIVAAPAYELQRNMTELRRAIGKWKMDAPLPTDSTYGVTNRIVLTDVHEIGNGLEMVNHHSFTSRDGIHISLVETEQFIPDVSSGEIKYIAITKYLNGNTQVLSGKVENRGNGALVAVMMHPDAPALKEGESEISIRPTGELQFANKRFDKSGKHTGSSVFLMRRL